MKLTSAQIVLKALHWAIPSIEAMIDADPSRREELTDLMNQMISYRNQRFGKPKLPKVVGILDVATMKVIEVGDDQRR